MEQPAFVDSRSYTVEEYLEIDERSAVRLDYFQGKILDMSGGTSAHGMIAMNIGGEIRQALKGKPCQVWGSDLRLQAHRSTLYTYPDLQVVCGEPIYTSDAQTTLTNPKVVVEVLSPSTEKYDRGDKFQIYLGVPSIADYVLVNQHVPRVEMFHRHDDGGWVYSHVEGLDAALRVVSIEVSIPLSEIYRNVRFDAPPPAATF